MQGNGPGSGSCEECNHRLQHLLLPRERLSIGGGTRLLYGEWFAAPDTRHDRGKTRYGVESSGSKINGRQTSVRNMGKHRRSICACRGCAERSAKAKHRLHAEEIDLDRKSTRLNSSHLVIS